MAIQNLYLPMIRIPVKQVYSLKLEFRCWLNKLSELSFFCPGDLRRISRLLHAFVRDAYCLHQDSVGCAQTSCAGESFPASQNGNCDHCK